MTNLLACVYEKVNLYAFFKKITKICYILGKMQKIIALEANIIQQFPCKCWSNICLSHTHTRIITSLMTKDLAQIIKVYIHL